MKKLLVAVLFLSTFAHADPVAVNVGQHTFYVPFQVVNGVQLYSPSEGKGFPGVETVLYSWKNFRATFGAAPVLKTSVNVPFMSIQTKLSSRFFDTSNNDIYFGAWVGKPSTGEREIFGIAASVELW